MSFGWLRRSSRVIAAIILLTSMWQLPHRSQDDEICAPLAAEAHDESKHVFTSPADLVHQDHCAVCHWLRWMNPLFSPATVLAGNSDPDGDVAPLTTSLRRDPTTDRQPARAPPSL